MARLDLALRKLALGLPDTEEGVACEGTALESATIRTGGKAFLFVRATDARLKLSASLNEAIELSVKEPERYLAGSGGWVLIRFGKDAAPPSKLLERWIEESYREFAKGGGGTGSKRRAPAKRTKASAKKPPARKKKRAAK